jgi:hypothetical protein
MTKQFSFTYDDDSKDRITLEYSPQADEKIDTSVENGIPFLYLNRPGMITLAKTLIKIANGDYSDGFHVHVHKDFNADEPERLAVLLSSDEKQ